MSMPKNGWKMGALDTQASFPYPAQLEANLLSNISDLSDDYANINGLATIHPS